MLERQTYESGQEREYDVAIMASSWDARSASVVGDSLRIKSAVVISPTYRGESGKRDEVDALLLPFLASVAEHVAEVEYPSEDLAEGWRRLAPIITSLCAVARDQPLRVFLDISAMSRYLFLACIHRLRSLGTVRSIVVHYEEGEYPVSSGGRYPALTVGRWGLLTIPGFGGEYSPTRSRSLAVSIGFEGGKTLRALMHADPSDIYVLLPVPGTRLSYEQKSASVLDAIRDEFAVQAENVFEAGAADVVRAAQAFLDIAQRAREANLSFVCAGTKAHSVAMGLVGLEARSASVLYPQAASHREVLVVGNGNRHHFRLLDSAVPL